MERDFIPGYNAPNSQWEYTSNFAPPLIPQNNAPLLFPIYGNQYGYSTSTAINGTIPLTGFQPFELYPNNMQCYNLPPDHHLYNLPTVGNNPNPLMDPDPVNPIWDVPVSYQTNVNGTVDGTESEMHEDTEEIDALLYSDSDEYIIEEEAASTGQSPPVKFITGEEVASTTMLAKKRRLGTDLDASLIDTATSAKCCDDGLDGSDAESSCVGGGEERENEEEMSEKSDCIDMNLKRKRIQETVGLLRRIIPGGKGKDAATILDEAISYLKSLKLKAKALGNF